MMPVYPPLEGYANGSSSAISGVQKPESKKNERKNETNRNGMKKRCLTVGVSTIACIEENLDLLKK
jgi:hypothetical protein